MTDINKQTYTVIANIVGYMATRYAREHKISMSKALQKVMQSPAYSHLLNVDESWHTDNINLLYRYITH